MRTTLDFAPLYRSSNGFDRRFNLLDNASRLQSIDSWPPYDIVKIGDDDYQITMAIAGYSQDELTLTQAPNLLIVTGQKAGEDQGEYLHHEIAGRAYSAVSNSLTRSKWSAQAWSRVAGRGFEAEIPEAMKPRRFEIGTRPDWAMRSRQLETDKHAA